MPSLALQHALRNTTAVFLAHLLYWTMPTALLLWIVALWRSSAAGCGPQLGRDDAVRAAVAAVMVGIVAVALPPAMRMQFDDTSICGIAQNMHEHRVAMMSMSGVPGPDGALQVLDWNLDKRPPLVPFLVSVLHDLALALQADRVVVLSAGAVVADGAPQDGALQRALEAVFGHAVRVETGGCGRPQIHLNLDAEQPPC